MTQILEKAKKILNDETYNAGWTIAPNVSEDITKKPNFSAQTCLQTKEHIYVYNPDYAKKQGEEKLIRTLKDLPRHEINHHKYKDCIGCPQTIEKHHDLFFIPAYEVLSKKGFLESDIDYLTNALQDTILHKDLNKNQKFSLDGIVNFFEDVGDNAPNKKYTEFYEGHSKLNLYLWGNKQQKKRLQRFYKHTDNVNSVLKSFLEQIGHAEGSSNINLDFLDESNWKDITRIYSKEFSKLMTPGYAMPTFNHSGAGTNGESSKKSENSEESNPDLEKQGNVFQKQMKTKAFKKGRVMDSNAKGNPAPQWIDSFEAKDMLYEGLAQKLIIKAETYTNPQTLPISWFGKRDFNEKDNLRHTTFGFNDNAEVGLKKKIYSVDIPISIKSSPKSFPEIKFGMIDISVSMKEDLNGGSNIGNTCIIPWGDNSKYHWATMTQYGIWEYLRQNHLLSQNNISGAFFGRTTQVVNGFNELKKTLLNPRFESSTKLDFSSIENFFHGMGNLIYTISDGELHNWEDISKSFISLAKNHSYVHLHMGNKNDMTKDLEKNNLQVVYGSDGKGIVAEVIDLTDNFLGGKN